MTDRLKQWEKAWEQINKLPDFIHGEKHYPHTDLFIVIYVRPYWAINTVLYSVGGQCRSLEERKPYEAALNRTFNTAIEAARHISYLAERANYLDWVKR